VNFRSHYYLSPSVITDAYFEPLTRTSSAAEKHVSEEPISTFVLLGCARSTAQNKN